MPNNIVELIAGQGINIDSNISNDTITIGMTEALPTNLNPLPVDRGGTGVNNLGQNIDALKTALVEAIKNIQGDSGNTIIGNELVINRKIYIETSGEWTAPKTGIYVIKAGGGGAGGGYILNSVGGYADKVIEAEGYNGTFSKNIVHLKKNEKLNIIIGAGGANSISTGIGSGNFIPPKGGSDTKITHDKFHIVAKGGHYKISYRMLRSLGGDYSMTIGLASIEEIFPVEDVVGLGYRLNRNSTAGKVSIEWYEE